MDNENKDIFDYDSYVKSNKKNKKKPQSKNTSDKKPTDKKPAEKKPAEKKAPDKKPEKQNNSAEEKKPAEQKTPASEKPKHKPERVKDGKDSIETIKHIIDDALDENADELAELVSDEPEAEIPVRTEPGRGKRRLYLITGIIVILLALVGLYSTVNFSVIKIKEFADNTQQKNEFAKFIYPIVICDPAPFNQTVKLRSDTMITAAIWDIILYEDKSKYESDFDYIIVPELDVEQHATKLFGSGLSFTHESILGADIQFYYEEDIKSYRIPENPKYFTYSPYIEDISKVGESYTLTVGYVSPTPAWLTLTSDEAPEPEKYVEYVVSKRGSEYTLVAIQESDLENDRHGL